MPKSAMVRDFMSGRLVTFSPDQDVVDAIHALIDHKIAGAPVVDDHGNLVGMLSEFDCMEVVLRAGYHHEPGGPVDEFMTHEVETVNADLSIFDLAAKFMESKFRRYPVLDGNRLVGQISRKDVLRALAELAKAT